jgi:transcriptional regulator with XRE-family HTH domain
VEIPPTTYWRIEIGLKSPSIRELGNLALVLGCGLEDLIEDKWRTWSLPGEPP